MTRTGGEKTDEILGKNGGGPEGLPHSIIVTPDGVEGDVPVVSMNGASAPHEAVPMLPDEATPPREKTRAMEKTPPRRPATKAKRKPAKPAPAARTAKRRKK
jgi:DNA topoisomerase-6 subunit B